MCEISKNYRMATTQWKRVIQIKGYTVGCSCIPLPFWRKIGGQPINGIIFLQLAQLNLRRNRKRHTARSLTCPSVTCSGGGGVTPVQVGDTPWKGSGTCHWGTSPPSSRWWTDHTKILSSRRTSFAAGKELKTQGNHGEICLDWCVAISILK